MTARLRKVPLTIFQRFFRTETLGGLVLLGFGLAALAIANSPLSEAYNHLWEIPLTVGIAPHELSLSLHEWINDGLMAVFFLLVGLEIKRNCWLVNCPLPARRRFPSRAQSAEWLCPRCSI
jgi:Na+:H+ antiporter, NhaA family